MIPRLWSISTAIVTQVRELAQDKPMAGLHLMVQKESQTIDIYVGPSEFVKVFEIPFAKGDSIRVVGVQGGLMKVRRWCSRARFRSET
jgi:hypothetical protein